MECADGRTDTAVLGLPLTESRFNLNFHFPN